MLAAVVDRYGPPEVVRVEELTFGGGAVPVAGSGELVVRVHAATVSSADARVRAMRMPSAAYGVLGRLVFGLRGPRCRVLGGDLSGVVVECGEGVEGWSPGDAVVASLGAAFGGHAEFVRVKSKGCLARRPAGLSHAEAAASVFGGMTALAYLRDFGEVGPGERVLVVGAAGAVGVAAVQEAARLGAMVTGVCRGANAELVRSLGAARTIDHTVERYQDGPERYDVVFDTVGVLGEREGGRLLRPGGRMLAAVMGLRQTVRVLVRRRGVLRGGIVTERRERLEEVLDLAARGVVRPVIGWRGGLHDVSAAHALADSGRKVGSAVIEMACERAGNGVV